MRAFASLGGVAIALTVAVTGCFQIHHPTRVQPGFRFEAATGVARVKPRPEIASSGEKPGIGYDVLLGMSYGSRVGERSGVLVALTVPATRYYYDGQPEQT